MKILHVYKSFFPEVKGGVAEVIRQLCSAHIDQNIEHKILTLSSSSQVKVLNFDFAQVHCVPRHLSVSSCDISFAIFAEFKRLAAWADIIHYHFPWPLMDVLYFCLAAKKPSIVTYHSDILRQKFLFKLYSMLEQKFLHSVNKIIATSPNYLVTSKNLQKFSHKVSVIPIGIHQDTYPQPTTELMNNWQMKFKQPFFLFVGALRYYKGLHILLAAMQKIHYPLVIIGNGNCKYQLLKQVEQQKLFNVHFIGEVTDADKIALIQLSYALILPSHLRTEAFGVSLLEGAMYGKPLICCDIGTGTTFINIHQQTGLVASANNVSSLAQAMQAMISNPQQAQAMGKNAQDRFNKLFTSTKMAAAYAKIYQQLLSLT